MKRDKIFSSQTNPRSPEKPRKGKGKKGKFI